MDIKESKTSIIQITGDIVCFLVSFWYLLDSVCDIIVLIHFYNDSSQYFAIYFCTLLIIHVTQVIHFIRTDQYTDPELSTFDCNLKFYSFFFLILSFIFILPFIRWIQFAIQKYKHPNLFRWSSFRESRLTWMRNPFKNQFSFEYMFSLVNKMELFLVSSAVGSSILFSITILIIFIQPDLINNNNNSNNNDNGSWNLIAIVIFLSLISKIINMIHCVFIVYLNHKSYGFIEHIQIGDSLAYTTDVLLHLINILLFIYCIVAMISGITNDGHGSWGLCSKSFEKNTGGGSGGVYVYPQILLQLYLYPQFPMMILLSVKSLTCVAKNKISNKLGDINCSCHDQLKLIGIIFIIGIMSFFNLIHIIPYCIFYSNFICFAIMTSSNDITRSKSGMKWHRFICYSNSEEDSRGGLHFFGVMHAISNYLMNINDNDNNDDDILTDLQRIGCINYELLSSMLVRFFYKANDPYLQVQGKYIQELTLWRQLDKSQSDHLMQDIKSVDYFTSFGYNNELVTEQTSVVNNDNGDNNITDVDDIDIEMNDNYYAFLNSFDDSANIRMCKAIFYSVKDYFRRFKQKWEIKKFDNIFAIFWIISRVNLVLFPVYFVICLSGISTHEGITHFELFLIVLVIMLVVLYFILFWFQEKYTIPLLWKLSMILPLKRLNERRNFSRDIDHMHVNEYEADRLCKEIVRRINACENRIQTMYIVEDILGEDIAKDLMTYLPIIDIPELSYYDQRVIHTHEMLRAKH